MEDIIKNATDVNVEQLTETGQQTVDDASGIVKTLGDRFGVDTAIIWAVALIAIIVIWRVAKKLGKIALILIIIGIIAAATAGTFLL